MNYDIDNTLSATTKDAKELANEIRQRVFVLYYSEQDEFDYSEFKPDPKDQTVTVMREVRPDPIQHQEGCNGLKYNTLR
jgi:hypothetical protein